MAKYMIEATPENRALLRRGRVYFDTFELGRFCRAIDIKKFWQELTPGKKAFLLRHALEQSGVNMYFENQRLVVSPSPEGWEMLKYCATDVDAVEATTEEVVAASEQATTEEVVAASEQATTEEVVAASEQKKRGSKKTKTKT